MKRRCITIIQSFIFALYISAQVCSGTQLEAIYKEAKQCYLKDDYIQLKECISRYEDLFNLSNYTLGDSAEIYRAYLYYIKGAYYYGFSEDVTYAHYSEYNYRKSLDIVNQRNIEFHTLVLHEELAQLYYKIKSYAKAKEQLDSALKYYDKQLNDLGITSYANKYYRTISQLAICNARLGHFNTALAQIEEAIEDYYKKHKDSDYFEALRKKGKILMLQADSLGSTHYDEAVKSYQQYVNERFTSISREIDTMSVSQRNQYWLATHQFLYDCFRLGNHAPEMLYNITLFSKDYLIRKNPTRIKWQQIKQALGKQDCAIEFVQYFGKNDERRMGCLVLRKNIKRPLFIDMFSADSLLNLSLTYSQTVGSVITATESRFKNVLYNNKQLPELIWSKRLMDAIGDANKVYFAPDGLFNQLAIEYMIPDTTIDCYRLSSTRILSQKKTVPKMDKALICGGIKYNTLYHPHLKENDVKAYRFLAFQNAKFNDLPWTKHEVDSIYTVRNNSNDILIEGSMATDEAFIQSLKQDYNVVHISTHGYYGGRIGIYNDVKPLQDDESMSRCGLLFAGAAKTIKDVYFDENMYDGVLSAEELSKQDFSKCELVVLSACQTGLGHLTDDGIYGIQRGLKLAGANAMVLSLWAVDDYSSCAIMRYFYEELERQKVKNIHEAFKKARQRLMQQKTSSYYFDESTLTIQKKMIRYNAPQYVNPFILIDAY